MLGLPAGMEWIVLLIVLLLLFGGTRLAGMGKGAGRAIREFKEEVRGDEAKGAAKDDAAADPKPIESVADRVSEPVEAPERTKDA